MGLQQIPAAQVLMPTRRTVVFTSSQTWTVPSSAMYVDVMAVGGGQGGHGGLGLGGGRAGGNGGAVTVLRDIYLGGTGTVSVTVGAGSNGVAGTTSNSNSSPSAAGFSAFGTYVYSGGGNDSGGGVPGYKGTINNPYVANDTTISNFAPILFNEVAQNQGGAYLPGTPQHFDPGSPTINSRSNPAYLKTFDGQGVGYRGGETNGAGTAGGSLGSYRLNASNTNAIAIPSNISSLPWITSTSFLGNASAGTASAVPTAGGDAGAIGFGGAGGASGATGTNRLGCGGGPGGGGGGGNGQSGQNGGNGGNAGTNTGAGGGGGGNTGSFGTGTGGNGGNGASGFVIVSYIGSN